MYKEVAFDPSCMSEFEYYNLVRQHFGYEKGRYISAEIRPWAREAMAIVKGADLKPVRKKTIKNYLNKLGRSRTSKEFLLTEDRRDVEAACWIDWLEKQLEIRDFSCTVAKDGEDGRLDIDQVNDGCEEWVVPPSISVSRTPEGIIGALRPLIILSRHLIIIDQFFRISTNPVLTELFKFIRNTGVQSLRIATSMESPSVEEVYDRDYRALNNTGLRFEWIKAPEKFFHDRYVITDVGAIRSGQGFMADVEKGTHSDLANINIIGQDEAGRTLRDLDLLLEDKRALLELSI